MSLIYDTNNPSFELIAESIFNDKSLASFYLTAPNLSVGNYYITFNLQHQLDDMELNVFLGDLQNFILISNKYLTKADS